MKSLNFRLQNEIKPDCIAQVTAKDDFINADLIRSLLREQHPDLADEPIVLGAQGWDNQIWRLGEDLAVRMPWATDAADELLLKEYKWVPLLGPRLPLPIPMPQRLGEPSTLFPRPWIITTWLTGAPADVEPITRTSAAGVLAEFLTALHQPAPADAPRGRGRAGALSEVASGVIGSLAAASEMGMIPDRDGILAVWEDAMAAPAWTGRRVWVHGDLHPANVLTASGHISGILDFGDLCAGDPAFDLASGWILFADMDTVRQFMNAYGVVDTAMWRRARGWAIWRALGSLFIADAGKRGQPGGKTTWGPPALGSLRRLVADANPPKTV